ncbi:peroxiredoxin [Fundicoccus culcitae]|uniref:Peroxiredoxin n=1 Tax=Fundicoccus culcitae TaxID=2969821 RepID=A0ABY5P483_9LACT|nr:peroxiredoxin [Fundicoccus culcitae]UUX33391.1 peroxiredoxin [Fundicoccus culcitae]
MEIKRGDQVIHLVGQTLAVGDNLPNVELVDRDHQPVQLADFVKGTTVISIVPDINTKTCSIQTNRFNAIAKEKDYPILTLSTNSPDDIVNWCQANNVDMTYLSDQKHHFSDASGLLMEENGKLARTVLVVDENSKIHYIEIVPDMRDEPNYDLALQAAETL